MDKKISNIVSNNLHNPDVMPKGYIDTKKYRDIYKEFANNKPLIVSCFYGVGKMTASLHTKYKMLIVTLEKCVRKSIPDIENRSDYIVNPNWERDYITDIVDIVNSGKIDLVVIEYNDVTTTALKELGYNIVVVYPDNEMRFPTIQNYIKKSDGRLANILHAGWEDLINTVKNLPEDIVKIKLEPNRYLTGLI